MKANSFANLNIVFGEVHFRIGMTKPRIELNKLGTATALDVARFNSGIDGLHTLIPLLHSHESPNTLYAADPPDHNAA